MRVCHVSPPSLSQSRELATMQSEYERRREELEQLLQSVDQQVCIQC